MEFAYRFPVARGIQANRTYYIAMVPLKMIPRLFPDDMEYVAPEYRAQRRLNINRIPEITNYILQNRDSYVFSALAASIDGDFRYYPNEKNADTGVLEVSMDARFLINDGQHRKAAICNALSEDETLGNETISVVFYEDQGLQRSQQIFTDLNKHAVKTSNSISELYDSRDSLAVITRKVVTEIHFLNSYTDKEKDILGKYSSNLFTLNNFYAANKRIFHSTKIKAGDEAFLLRYWKAVVDNLVQWKELEERKITKIDLRENYIVTQNVVIQSLGRIGRSFYQDQELNCADVLKNLQNINWKRNAGEWYLRTINMKGRMITSEPAVILTANVIKKTLGLPLDEDEKIRETAFLMRRQ